MISKELRTNEQVLEFSPSRSVSRYMKSRLGDSYLTSDFCGEFKTDRKYDINAIPESDETFNTIIVYHVLEHIEDDVKAMKELFRVLKKGGSCWIQTPFKEGDILEDFSIKKQEERKRVFGQEDHVRIYTVDALAKRLRNAGFAVEVLCFNEETNNPHGFSEKEFVLKASKAR